VSVTTGAPVDRSRAQAEITATLARLLGFDVDLDEFYRRTRHDPHLGPLAHRYRGLKPPRFPTMFECLANAIACQQLTLTVGIVLLNRLAESFGPIGTTPSGADVHAFPDAADLISGTPAGLRKLGLSTRKAEYLLELARGVADGSVDLAALSNFGDDTVSASLQELRGIGRWSAEYALLRGLGRLGVFPSDDVGARHNLARRLGLDRPLDYEGVRGPRRGGRHTPASPISTCSSSASTTPGGSASAGSSREQTTRAQRLCRRKPMAGHGRHDVSSAFGSYRM
jgi:DNA-3-methyladenine glycosylase II